MRIAILGTGYVGLVTGADFACRGFDVTCVDINIERINDLQRGVMPFFEKDLPERVAEGVVAGKLFFTTNAAAAIADADVVMCAVATPTNSDGYADLSGVFAVAETFAQHAKDGAVLVNKSTVPVGTADACRKRITQCSASWSESERSSTFRPKPTTVAERRFAVVSNPEFLSQGTAVFDTAHPSRIVVGIDAEEAWAGNVMRELNASFISEGIPYCEMSTHSAETVKCAANAFLATKISFINEIANFCERTGGDVDDVAKAVGLDPRIGPQFFRPGLGYGGSCLSKDTRALITTGSDAGYAFRILPNVEAVNDAQKFSLIERYKREVGSFSGKRVAVWGLAFKADTDDVRNAPSIPIVAQLLKDGATVCVFDPLVTKERAANHYEGVEWAQTAMNALQNVDVLLVLTEAAEFINSDINDVVRAMATPHILDGRRVFAGKVIPKTARYFCIGCG